MLLVIDSLLDLIPLELAEFYQIKNCASRIAHGIHHVGSPTDTMASRVAHGIHRVGSLTDTMASRVAHGIHHVSSLTGTMAVG